MPERESETKLTRATPRTVLPDWSMRPSVVKKNTSVPSGTKVPAGSVTTAVTTEMPPFAITNVGLACRKIVEPLGAVSGASSQLASERNASASGRELQPRHVTPPCAAHGATTSRPGAGGDGRSLPPA